MNMKQHILLALREEIDQWEELLSGMDEPQMTILLLPTDWSIKDVIAHLRTWQQRTIARVEAAVLDKEPRYPQWPVMSDPDSEGDPYEINAWIYAAHHDQPWSQVHQNWREGFEQILQFAAQISERELLDAQRYPWLNGYPLALILLATYDHHQEHFDKLVDWLQVHGNPDIAA